MQKERWKRTIAIIFMAVSLLSAIPLAYAQNEIELVERPDTEFLILGLDINGYSRSDGIDAYLPEEGSPEDVLVPLGALSRALSAAIEVDPAMGEASGFFLSEDRDFQLDLVNKQVISARKALAYEDGDAEAHYDDIYVKASALEDWFGLTINLETSSLTLFVDTDQALPFQEAEERQNKARRLLTKSRKSDFDPKEAFLLPYGMITKPSFVIQESLTTTSTSEQNTVQSTTTIQSGFDLLKFGADVNLAYAVDNQDQNQITNSDFTLSRSDPKQDMLGFFNAGRIDIGDINFSPVPLLTGSQRGAGISISSEPDFGFRISQELGNIRLDGDAPIGWDAELYRNGQFIDFQTIEADGRFDFQDITLINGFNRFQILLFGPEGQEETITRDVFSGPNMLAEGKMKYDLSVGLPQSDFLPLAENARDDSRFGFAGDFLYGVNDYLTLGGNFYRGPIDDDEDTGVVLKAATALFGFNAQTQLLYANDNRTALQGALRRQFGGVNAAFTHTVFNNFEEDDQDIERSTELSLSKSFGRFNITFLGEHETFQEEEDKTTVENIISSEIAGVKFTNSLVKTISKDDNIDDLEGDLSVFTEVQDVRLRSNLTYDLDQDATDNLKTLRLSAQRNFGDYNSLRLISSYDFPSEILSGNIRYSREFGPVTVDFDVGANTEDVYSAGVSLRTSLQPIEGQYEFVSPRLGTLANLNMRAFIDVNGNKKYDAEDSPIENILFKTARGEVEAMSGIDGIARMNGLAETPTRIYVSQADIPSIYIIPATKGVDLIPRRGAESIVDFPFTKLGEVDGFVMDVNTGEALSNIPVKIINAETGEDVAEMNSEYDGYFVFTALPIGIYKVIASVDWFEEGGAGTASRVVELTVEESNVLDVILKIDGTMALMDQPIREPQKEISNEEAEPLEGDARNLLKKIDLFKAKGKSEGKASNKTQTKP